MIQWQPAASIDTLRARAEILHRIRLFFREKGVLEVETPVLTHATGTDPFIQSIEISKGLEGHCYLQTSPEFCMKRLLAAASGSIYQIGKAFRAEECGRFHNPEFTILEWYRIDFDHHALMDEMDELLRTILKTEPAERTSYQRLFEQHLSLNPHSAGANELRRSALSHGIGEIPGIDPDDRDVWLQLLMSEWIEPRIGKDKPIFVYDFPMSQASLARIRQDELPVAERFEVYFHGIELANGFHELEDAAEQRRRFQQEQRKRHKLGYPEVPLDEYFLAALKAGLPHCSGVALGIDRLVMLALKHSLIEDVMAFPFSRV